MTTYNSIEDKYRFSVEDVREGCADLWQNVECLTCSRLLGYIRDLLHIHDTRTAPATANDDALTAAFHRGVDAAEEAIRSEVDGSLSDNDHYYAAVFINAIARKCGGDRAPATDYCYAEGDEGSKYCGSPKAMHCSVIGESITREHILKCMEFNHLVHHAFVGAPAIVPQRVDEGDQGE